MQQWQYSGDEIVMPLELCKSTERGDHGDARAHPQSIARGCAQQVSVQERCRIQAASNRRVLRRNPDSLGKRLPRHRISNAHDRMASSRGHAFREHEGSVDGARLEAVEGQSVHGVDNGRYMQSPGREATEYSSLR